MRIPVFCIITLFLGGFLIGFGVRGIIAITNTDAVTDERVTDGPIPSLCEIQERLGIKPDGVYGPETKKKWLEAIGNQEAIKYSPKEAK